MWVCGTVGGYPYAVSRSIEAAMLIAASFHMRKDDPLPVWTCRFLDDEPEILRCTATVDGQEIYVESCAVETHDTARRTIELTDSRRTDSC